MKRTQKKMKIYEKQKGKWKMIETCVVAWHVPCAWYVCPTRLCLCSISASSLLCPRPHAPRRPPPAYCALLFPFQSLSIAGKCKQIRKQSLATFFDLTWARTKVCYKKMMRSAKRGAIVLQITNARTHTSICVQYAWSWHIKSVLKQV